MQEKWLSILEYANYKNKSISTVRRYIKSNKVDSKEENGKYFILVKNFKNPTVDKEIVIDEIELLKRENIRLQNELNEAKMLIDLYEKGQFLSSQPTPPEMPSLI